MREPISDQILERVAVLSARALATPKFDNGDKSEAGAMAELMSHQLLQHELKDVDDYGDRVERFREELALRLKYQRDNEGQPDPDRPGMMISLRSSLDVDYHPDPLLSQVAEAVGIPPRALPWKSNVSFWNRDSVTACFGYGAPDENHYPLADGRWLITSVILRGHDKDVIIAAVEAGQLPGLTVETPSDEERRP